METQVSSQSIVDHSRLLMKHSLAGSHSRGYYGRKDANLITLNNVTDISLDGNVKGLKLRQLFFIIIVMEEKNDVLYLSIDAIRIYQDRPFVIVQRDGHPRRVDVELGIQEKDQIEIVKGLEQGQVIVAP